MALALTPLGCATSQQLLELDTQYKARMAKMETGLATEKERVDQLATQLAAVSATATEATRIGNDAWQRDAVDGRLTKTLANRLVRTQVQEFKVKFEPGRAELSSAAQQTLQDAVKLLAGNTTYTADIIGHTDEAGPVGYNVNLSWRREEMVRRFLLEKGTAPNRFSFIGLGEDGAVAATAAGRARERYVHVIVFRPTD